ncbi:hypothetical protein LCGC14_1709610 [marine sediment metagenome]|uniref:Uncharacterized protein n=1 Tax=marine sediment metagenome TaxID=412755 RepID=A0A0F9HF77_9ZZZZ
MKVEVEIPEKKDCTWCPFEQEIIDSWGMEESHNWCAYLQKDLNEEAVMGRQRIKKHPDCPSLKEIKNG